MSAGEKSGRSEFKANLQRFRPREAPCKVNRADSDVSSYSPPIRTFSTRWPTSGDNRRGAIEQSTIDRRTNARRSRPICKINPPPTMRYDRSLSGQGAPYISTYFTADERDYRCKYKQSRDPRSFTTTGSSKFAARQQEGNLAPLDQ